MRVKDQLLEAQLENLAVDPGSGIVGRMFYNTASNRPKVDTGTAIKEVWTGLEFDYHVPVNDGTSLLNALQSTSYKSVFIPNGTYTMGTNGISLGSAVKYVQGESRDGVIIQSSRTASSSLFTGHASVDLCFLTGFTVQNTESANQVKAFTPSSTQDKHLFLDTIKIDGFDCGMYGDSTYIRNMGGNNILIEAPNKSQTHTGAVVYCEDLMDVLVDMTNITAQKHTGITNCKELINCEVNLGYQGSTAGNVIAFDACHGISNARVACNEDNSSSPASRNIIGMKECYRVNSSYIEFVHTLTTTTGGNVNGMYDCHSVSSSYVKIAITDSNDNLDEMVAFIGDGSGSARMYTSCGGEFTATLVGDNTKYKVWEGIFNVSACKSYVPTGYTNIYDFKDNKYITACFRDSIGNGGQSSGNTEAAANFFADN